MKFRISPVWWPLLGCLSPAILPIIIKKNATFKNNRVKAAEENRHRIASAPALDLPRSRSLELTILAEGTAGPGFKSEAGISYLLQTDNGRMLFDVGFGPDRTTLSHNAAKLGITFQQIDALAISHLHPDHMGGMTAFRKNRVMLPDTLGNPEGKTCYLPADASAQGLSAAVVTGPRLLQCGVASTGPLARSLFFLGYTEEQSLVVSLKDKGLVVLVGCGHPTLPVILEMVRKLSPEPVYAIAGGLHFPISGSRERLKGVEVTTIIGTGLPPWRRLQEKDLDETAAAINAVSPEFVYLSPHDSCDFAINAFRKKLKTNVNVLTAGATYRF